MPHHTFESIQVASSAAVQPLIGTKTTAAVVGTRSQDQIDPITGWPVGAPQTVAVGNSDFFADGDIVYLDTGANAEKLAVQGDPASATGIVLRPVKNHASGVFVTLYKQWTGLSISLGSTNAGTVYVFVWNQAFEAQPSFGRKSLAPAMAGAAPVAPAKCLLTSLANTASSGIALDAAEIFGAPGPFNTAFYWIGGTAGDSYLPSVQSS